jgi:NDP-sugar pyrophosphorylase family protein
MRAMIVAAGLGTRLRPLTHLRPKPVVPVRGLPLLAYPLALLAAHGVNEVIVNTHHLPERLRAAADACRPPGVRVSFSHEERLLGTGGGIRRAAAFLRESDPCLILGGDMVLDYDLRALVAAHRERENALTLLLREDRRAEAFGTIGIDANGRLRRIGRRFDLGGEVRAGLYAWANVVSSRAFDALPEEEVFSHLDGWVVPLVAGGAEDVRAIVATESDSVWEPVGTPAEYLAANLVPHRLSYLDADAVASHAGARFAPGLVIGAGATLGRGVCLERAVVWDGEHVPDGLVRHDGVFAGGAFHPCLPHGRDGAA